MTNSRKLIVLAASAGIALAAPPDRAAAQVFIDPGSPSSKEYGIPLEDARRNASGSGSELKVEQGARSAPLFGEGVGDGAAATGGGGNGKPGPSKRSPQKDGGSSPGTVRGGQVGEALRSTNATVPQGGIGSTATIAALALSVLLLGGVIGSIARRRTG